jgi:osmoprotectant transport system ATP-binding protein
MLALENVTKRYDGKTVVDNIDLTLDRAQTYVLIGQSGCGKSTVLRLLIGLVAPDAGRVLLEGQSLATCDLPRARRRFGYVIQEGGLFPHLTARQNIGLVAEYLDWPADKTRQRCEQLTALTQFPPDGLDRYPSQLSGGQRQRVSLMRALMLDPEFLLLDEPLAALDPMIRCELQQQLKHIFGALGKTVIMVTHDLHEAAFFGDQIILLRAGRIVQQGTIRSLAETPAEPFVTDFMRAQQTLFGEGTS